MELSIQNEKNAIYLLNWFKESVHFEKGYKLLEHYIFSVIPFDLLQYQLLQDPIIAAVKQKLVGIVEKH